MTQQELYSREDVMRLLCSAMNASADTRHYREIVSMEFEQVKIGYLNACVNAAKVYLGHYEDQDISELRALADEMKEIVMAGTGE